MGVTIHFEGTLRSEEALERLRHDAQAFAAARGWSVASADAPLVTLQRVRNEQDWDYEGPVRGVVVYPHVDCDPIRLEFDRDLYVQEFAKTQFAGADVHASVIAFLHAIEPLFRDMRVEDESEYWATNDRELLESHLRSFNAALEDELRKHPGARVKVRMADGRIVDLLT